MKFWAISITIFMLTSFLAIHGNQMNVGNIPSGCIPSLPEVAYAALNPKKHMGHFAVNQPTRS